MPWEKAKKLVSVSTTFMLVIEDSEEPILVNIRDLEQITYIQYHVVFLSNICMEDERIKRVKQWSKPKSVRKI